MGLTLGIIIIILGSIAGLVSAGGDDIREFNLNKAFPLIIISSIIGSLFIITHYYPIAW